jgi:hypothetical protein
MLKHVQIALVAFVLLAGTALAQSVLNNDSIIKMSKACFGDDVIVSMVKSQPGNYTVDPDAVIQLKTAGLSEKIINAMIEKNSGSWARLQRPLVLGDA